jgi:hypothetical protein
MSIVIENGFTHTSGEWENSSDTSGAQAVWALGSSVNWSLLFHASATLEWQPAVLPYDPALKPDSRPIR